MQLAESLGWVGGALATIFFLPFSFSFPIARRSFRELWTVVIWPLLVFVPGFLVTDLFINQRALSRFGEGYETASGPYMWVFILFLIVYWSWSIYNLVLSYRKLDGIHHKQLQIILFGTMISLSATLFMDVYIPLTQVSHIAYVGSLFTVVWLGSSTYILLKK